MSAPAVGIMRLTNHPRNDELRLMKFGPELNRLIGTFGPAQQALDLGGYVMHREQLSALKNWCRYNAVTLFDDSRANGEPTKAVECGNVIATHPAKDGSGEWDEICCAAYPSGRIPKFCGSCGQPANPVTYGADEPDIGVKCPACTRVNHGGPAYCVACGVALPERHLSAPAVVRVKGEPVVLADAMATTPELQGGAV